jgi:hypothetical protein
LLIAMLLALGGAEGARAGGDEPGLAPPAAKRVGPPAVPPVEAAGLRFEVVHWGRERGLPQNGGYVAAVDPQSGAERWLLRVYTIEYDRDLEEDVQDVFIESMRWNPTEKVLEIRDERERTYTVDPATRAVRQR